MKPGDLIHHNGPLELVANCVVLFSQKYIYGGDIKAANKARALTRR